MVLINIVNIINTLSATSRISEIVHTLTNQLEVELHNATTNLIRSENNEFEIDHN